MLFASPEWIAFEMFLFQNAPNLLPLPTALDPEYLHEVPLETPQSTQGATPDPSPPHIPDPTSLPPQFTTPADDRMSLCPVCSAQTSLSPPAPPPQTAASPPPKSNWHKIPQKIYDHGRKQWDYTPSEGISFEVEGCPGMNMGDALRKRFTGLVGRDDLVLRDAGSVILCRLEFPEYPSNGSVQVGRSFRMCCHALTTVQISTTHWNKAHDPITRGELAYHVARKLKQYLDAMAVSSCRC